MMLRKLGKGKMKNSHDNFLRISETLRLRSLKSSS
jgi:hypothetical protein